MLLELARKTRHRHNKSGIIILCVRLVRCVTGESPNYLMPVMMVSRHSSVVLRSLFPCLKQVMWLNLDKMFLIFVPVFNLLDTPVFLES